MDPNVDRPTAFPYNTQYLQVQTSWTKAPLSPMPIRALEVGTSGFLLWGNVPTTATLIGNKGKIVTGGHVLNKERVMMDGM